MFPADAQPPAVHDEPLPIDRPAGVERQLLINAQIDCHQFGGVYAACLAVSREQDELAAVRAYALQHPEHMKKRNPDGIVKHARRYELLDGLLMRRVYDAPSHEVQLRIVAPHGGVCQFILPGHGPVTMGVRERVLLEYHNSKHLGVEKTAQRILQDWYWPGLYEDVDDWCSQCDLCRGEKGAAAVSAWSRTELYSRPFRVIQFDTVDCAPGDRREAPDHPYRYLLTATCCFSRWSWLIPVVDKSAESVGKALLEKVLLDLAMFPTVLRSDRECCEST